MMQNKKKKVLFFLPSSVGGAERMTVTIAKMLPIDMFEVAFVIVDRTQGNIVSLISDNSRIIFVRIKHIGDFVTIRMAKVIREEKPDVVFSSLMYLNYRLVVAKFVSGCKSDVIIRNCHYLNILRFYETFLCRWTYCKAKYIIAQQEEMQKEIVEQLKLPINKVKCVHNPLDTEKIDLLSKAFNPFKEYFHCTNYVCTARIDSVKGQDLLIKSFSLVLQSDSSAHLYLIGEYNKDSDFYLKCKKLVQDFSLESNVHFVGFEKNPYKWVKNASCFVLPSRKEGLPNSLVEAMYLQTPVVASVCIPIIDRMISDGKNGYKVPPDNVEAMAEAMKKAIHLKQCTMTYRPAETEDIIKLFKD